MKNRTIKLCFLFLCISIAIRAQESILTSGGNSSNSVGSVSYSIGQVVYNTSTNAFGSINQGVQQSYEILTLGHKETESNISIILFPNPTTNYFTIEISDYKEENLSFNMYDIQGKIITRGIIFSDKTYVNTINLTSATYFLKITNIDNKIIQSFKIIKK